MKTSFAIATFLLVVGRTAAAPLLSSALSPECERIISCLTKITNTPLMDDIFGTDDMESVEPEDICNDIVLLFGGETGVNAICGATDVMMNTGSPTMTPENDQLTCSNSPKKKPEYPIGMGYELLTAPLLDLYLFGGREARSDANAYSQLYIGNIAAKAAQAAATICDSDVFVVLTAGVCLAVKVAVEVVVVGIEETLESLNIQDGLIDSAEIQAAYLNTETIISQNCGIQTDIDLDSLKLSIEPTDGTAMTFLILSTERGVEKGIDLVIDCFDEADKMYRTQPFTREEISEGTTLVKFLSPKSEKKSKKSEKETTKSEKETKKSGKGKGKGKGGCSKISRFKGTTKEVVSRSGVRSVRTVIRRTD